MTNCSTCFDERWVCEEHGRPGNGDDCCGIGMPCPACNVAPEGVFPAFPPGSVLLDDFHGHGLWAEN